MDETEYPVRKTGDPVMRETDAWGFARVWHCAPPAYGEAFYVVREEWTGERERHIYEWRPAVPRTTPPAENPNSTRVISPGSAG